MDEQIVLGDITFTPVEVTRAYRTLIIQSPNAIILHDNLGFRYVNPAGLRLFGVSELSELRGHSLLEFIADNKRESVATWLASSSTETGSPLEAKLCNTLDQEIDVEITATSLVVGGQEIVQAKLRDVSSRKLIEEIHRRQHEWKIIRDLIQHLADKTLNPLTTIEGFLTLIKEGSENVSNIDILLDEAKSIQQIWRQAIEVAQNMDTTIMTNEDVMTHVHTKRKF